MFVFFLYLLLNLLPLSSMYKVSRSIKLVTNVEQSVLNISNYFYDPERFRNRFSIVSKQLISTVPIFSLSSQTAPLRLVCRFISYFFYRKKQQHQNRHNHVAGLAYRAFITGYYRALCWNAGSLTCPVPIRIVAGRFQDINPVCLLLTFLRREQFFASSYSAGLTSWFCENNRLLGMVSDWSYKEILFYLYAPQVERKRQKANSA